MKNKWMLWLTLVLLLAAACAQTTPVPDSSAGQKATQVPALMSGVQEISGVVLEGGDQTPEGLMDVPRVFLYQVRLDSGEEINLTYTVYPPSPSGQKSPIQLTFIENGINSENYLTARGTYDANSKTLTVAEGGDFIKTLQEKP